jgi:colanic acid biosynthesis protein WcaH
MPKDEIEFISPDLYGRIMELLPIASVEAVIVVDGSLLFLRRKNDPVKGEWWFPGGRIHRGESFEQTLRREVREETGLEVESCRFIGAYSRVFPERHDITIAYLCTCKGKIALNGEHSEYILCKDMPKDLHPYLLETIADSKWTKPP